ncbi:protein kinase domain-containing protein [Metaclostridioides mangenotii]|uniref:Serine/threonine protein kinase n=1 Tax=Metaclostridioides mangenotii TaxID=1540 RepID=A0ABS4E7F8_9FIRM|nr:protein kinase [Clostridioides mangenotii]MBP1853867.1 serine/threonine protein kinase [Clostridioides mangenotii]
MYLIDKKYQLLESNDFIEDNKLCKAKDIRNDRDVLIKLIEKSDSICDEFLINLIDEVTVLSDLNSPYILKTLDVGVDKLEGSLYFYIVCEDSKGIELNKLLDSKILQLDYVIKIVIQVLKALESAHSIQAYHGSLKPSSIIVDKDYNVKVCDFGITRANKGVHTRSSDSLDYMCPHQLCVDYTDKDSDFFSLGEIFYEAHFGEKVFGCVSSEKELLKNIDKGINWNDSRYKNENKDLIYVMSKLLDRDKSYSNSQEVIIDLSSIMYEKASEEDELRDEFYDVIKEKEKREKNKIFKNIILAVLIILMVVTIVIVYF